MVNALFLRGIPVSVIEFSCFVIDSLYGYGFVVHAVIVQCHDSLLGLAGIRHFNERLPSRPSIGPVSYHDYETHQPINREKHFQVVFTDIFAKSGNMNIHKSGSFNCDMKEIMCRTCVKVGF